MSEKKTRTIGQVVTIVNKELERFESALYYDCCDSERLSHSDPEEAIDELLENAWEDGRSMVDIIREESPVTVIGYAPEELPSKKVKHDAEWLFEEMKERFDDDYGDPEGYQDTLTVADEAELKKELEAWTAKFLAAAHVFRCDRHGQRTYEEAELLEMFAAEIAEEAMVISATKTLEAEPQNVSIVSVVEVKE